MKIWKLGWAAALLFGCQSELENINLLAAPGAEKATEFYPEKSVRPFSQVVKTDGAAWRLLSLDQAKLSTLVLSGVKLDPDGIYELKATFAGQEGTRLILKGVEWSGERVIKSDLLMSTTAFLNVNGMTTYAKEFAVSPDCAELYPALSFIKARSSAPRVEFFVEELAIRRVGDMKRAPAAVAAVNFAADFDFARYPEGDFAKIHKGNGPNAAKWSDVKAEIVTCDGEKVLHLVRTPANYIYPFLELPDFPIDPKYHFGKFTFAVKGSGVIRPGVWWKRSALGFDYYHAPEVRLTDQWQVVEVVHPCMTSDVKSATVSFTSEGNGEFFIRDVAFHLL